MPNEITSPLDDFFNWFFQTSFLGIQLADLTKFCGFIVAGLILGRLLRYPISRWLERFGSQEDATAGHRIAASVERSVFLLVFCIVMKSGAVDVLHLPGWAWEKSQSVIIILMALAATMLFLQFVDIALFGLRKKWQGSKSQIDESLINFMRKGIRIIVILLAALVAADNIGFKVTGVIAGLGVGGAALALAAQGLIGNILGTIEIVADKLFRVGDRIHFDAFNGFVTEIGLRSTKIRALTGEQIIVPNKKMAEVQIRNFSKGGTVQTSVTVGVVYSTTHDRVRQAMQILDEIFKARPDVDSHQIYLKNLGAYALDLEVLFWARYSQSEQYNDLVGQLHLEIKRRFDEAAISFAFPTQTLHVAKD